MSIEHGPGDRSIDHGRGDRSIDHGRGDRSGDGRETAPPVDPDRPYVDGTAASPEQLRAEVDQLSDEHVERVEAAREELAATLTELTGRLDPRPHVQALGQRVVAAVRQPVVLGSAAALALLVVLLRVRRAAATDHTG
jgi:hypothetical protein